MTTPSEFLSTQEVSTLFRVTETTVKRWADGGLIPCHKSPGGHRKFRFQDVAEFAEARGYPVAGTLDPPLEESRMEQVRVALHTGNYHTIAQVLLKIALAADPDQVYRLLLYLSRHKLKLATLADEVLRPPLVRIGELWESGKLPVDQEHRSSRALIEAMIRLAPELHRKNSNGLHAACACLEGERHEIGLRGLAFALESEGWEVHYIGADTPYDTAAAYARKWKPDLFCVSFTAERPDPALRKGFASVARAVAEGGGKMMAGGFFASNFTLEDLRCDFIAASVTEGIAWTRDAFTLRPGPRKKKTRGGG